MDYQDYPNYQEQSEDQTPGLSVGRVRRVLSARGHEYVTAESGETGLEDGDETIWIAATGPDDAVLTIRGTFPGALDIDKLHDVRSFIADWHRQHYWPTVSYGIADDGAVSVTGHCVYDFESGVADRQLDDVLAMSVTKIRELFREVGQL